MSAVMPHLSIEHQYFTSVDGDQLAYFALTPDADARAVVIVLHGYSEYSGRYLHLVDHLLQHGYAVAAMDHRGHGRSEGQRGYIPSFAAPAADVAHFVGMMQQRFPDLAIYIFAHSMGGAITVEYLLTHQSPPVQGMILSGPGLRINYELNPVVRGLSEIAARVMPRAGIVGLRDGMTTRDPAIVADAKADTLVHHGKVPLRTGQLLLDAWEYFAPRLPQFALPMLLLHGTADGLADPDASREFYAMAASDDKTLKLYEDMLHEVVNEVGREEVFADIIAWLDARV